MQRLKWRLTKKCCRGTLQKLSQHAVSQERRPWTKLSSDPGETTAVTSELWSTMIEHSTHEQPPPGRRCHQELNVEGAISVDVAADRRCRRKSTSAVFCTDSARYCGAVPLRQRCVKTHNRNWILSGPVTSVFHGGEGICVLTSLLSTNAMDLHLFAANLKCGFSKSLLRTSSLFWYTDCTLTFSLSLSVPTLRRFCRLRSTVWHDMMMMMTMPAISLGGLLRNEQH